MNTGKQVMAPLGLHILQQEFGRSIRTPFSFSTGHFKCQKEKYGLELTRGIKPRNDLLGADRLAVYNEQYWYRLLTLLQENFPLLTRTLGYWTFNQLATEYLHKHPSTRPYLDSISDYFPGFVRNHPDFAKPDLIQITDLEFAFLSAFNSPSQDPIIPHLLTPAELESLGREDLVFQSYVTLGEEDWDFLGTRLEILETNSKATPHPEKSKGYWVIYRYQSKVEWQRLNPIQYALLRELKSGYPLEDACERVCATLDEEGQARLFQGISAWFADWTRLGFFVKPPSRRH